MTPKFKLALFSFALVALTAFLTAGIIKAATPQDQDEQAKMMELYMKMAKPGKPHQELARLVGQWNVEMSSYCTPGNPMTTKGSATFETILGGRFVLQRQKADMGNGMTMEGFQILGYDNVQKKYVGVWLDNWSTGIHASTGQVDENGQVCMQGLMKDAMTPEGRPFRSVQKQAGNDKFTIELHDTKDGKEFKMMDIVYTRVKP